MESPERPRDYVKRDTYDDSDGKSGRAKDDEEFEGDDKKYRSSKSRKPWNEDEPEALEGSGRKRSSGDGYESRKRSGGSSRAGSDEDDNESRKKSRSKQIKKKQEESTLEKLSNWYQGGDLENKFDAGEKSERRKSSKFFDQESSEGRNRSKDARSHDEDVEKELDGDSRYSEKRESSRDRGHESLEQGRSTRRRWDESDAIREEKRVDSERSKSKGRSEAPEEDNEGSSLGRENRSDLRDKSRREMDRSNRSRTPEKSGRRHHESENEAYMDDRTRGRDDSWSDRNKDREAPRENWKKNSNDKETKDRDTYYDHGREWESQRHGRERTDKEWSQGRLGSRKDNRTEAVKTSSNYGIASENYDVIEIQTKPFDYGRESGSTFARKTEVGLHSEIKTNDDEWMSQREDRASSIDVYGPGPPADDSKDRFLDDSSAVQDPNSGRDDPKRGHKGVLSNRMAGGQSSSGGSQPPHVNHELGSLNRAVPPGAKGNSRVGRGGGRGRPAGRDNQQVGLPVPMMGSPFGPLGMPPPGPMQSLNPSMSPAPGPPMSHGVFIPPFSPPIVWPGARGVDMNMLAVPPGISPVVPHGPSGPRFSPNVGTPPNAAIHFNPPSSGRGESANISGASFNAIVPVGRGQPQDKSSGGWVPLRNSGPPGKAPSRGEQNDYSQNFVDTGMRPQNFIRELELTNVVEDYPKLRELIQRKDEIVSKASSPPMYYKCDLREFVLTPEFFGTKFDVILVDPPWEEYVHRAPGVTDLMEYWTFEEIMNLKIEAIADTPSFIFLWVGDGVGLEQGRQCLKKWGFRRCEDICWVKTNKTNATPGLRHDAHTLFQRSKEHCLMGIKGTVRRSTDGHIIHANIDTDVVIAEEPPYGSTAKPEDMYRIIEHFALGRRRLELFGEDHNIRSGWLTVGKGLSSSNFNAEAYTRTFADKDGKVWQGGGGRNPPPEAPHLVVTTPEIEALRPKSPMKNQQQQQQSASISLVTASSSNQRSTGNSPQNHIML